MKFIILSTLPTLNQYIDIERTHRQLAADMKRDAQYSVELELRPYFYAMNGVSLESPVSMVYRWFAKDKHTDKSNISSMGRKIIEDALVSVGILKDDGWNHIEGFSDVFYIDKDNPRVEIEIWEV